MGDNGKRKLLNDDLIIFISNVLLLCDAIRKIYKRYSPTRVEVSAAGSGGKSIVYGEEKKHNFAEELLNYVFFCCQDSFYKFEIKSLDRNVPAIQVEFTERLEKLQFLFIESTPNFEEIKNNVKALFVEEYERENFLGKLHILQKALSSLGNKVPFGNRKEILKYLDAYVQVLSFLVMNEEFIEEKSAKKNILKPLLNFCDFACGDLKSQVSVCMSLNSPVSSYLMLLIYQRLEEYLELDVSDDADEIITIYREIFAKKIRHAYRWYLANENHELYHAAISAFVETRPAQKRLLVPVHKLSSYNSYEGIRELRLAEKILFELEDWECAEDCEADGMRHYKIALFGDFQKQPLIELCEYLSDQFEKSGNEKYRNIKLCFSVYTNTDYELKNDWKCNASRYSYELIRPDGILKNRLKMDGILDKNDLLFILDSVDLYKEISVEEDFNTDFYKQRLEYSDDDELELEISENRDIKFCGKFRDLHEGLTTYLYSGKWGNLKKEANQILLKYLDGKIAASQRKKAVYVYVSDLDAFHDIYCNDNFFVRKEQYNEKEIGIIRYSTRKEAALENAKNSPHMLVFNMWQFVKHIVIDERAHYIEKFLPGISDKADLKQVHIGIRYDNWNQNLILDYCLEKKEFLTPEVDQAVRSYLTDILIPILNRSQDEMYFDYVHRAIVSFLYGNVADIEDMLFVHLFKNHRERIGRAKIADIHEPELVKSNINKLFKYSFKRFYDMAMDVYDISATEYIGQYITLNRIVKSNDLRRAWQAEGLDRVWSDYATKQKFFSQILKACESLNYEDSFLYRRCMRELKKVL